jgi:hypothetical protein
MTEEKIVVYVESDHSAEDPCSYDGWQVHSFCRSHYNYADPYAVGIDPDTGAPDEELQAKIDTGLAFPLSYFEHGMCEWSLQDEGYQCRWDSVAFAGLLVWGQDESDLGPSTFEERQKDARSFIKTYTDWCNGRCFGYRAVKVRYCPSCGQEEIDDDHVDSCWGFIGGEALVEGIRESLGDGPFEIRGECRGVLDDSDIAA